MEKTKGLTYICIFLIVLVLIMLPIILTMTPHYLEVKGLTMEEPIIVLFLTIIVSIIILQIIQLYSTSKIKKSLSIKVLNTEINITTIAFIISFLTPLIVFFIYLGANMQSLIYTAIIGIPFILGVIGTTFYETLSRYNIFISIFSLLNLITLIILFFMSIIIYAFTFGSLW